MNVKQVNPEQANEILQKDSAVAYIDVRTEQEFQNGHVPNAVNIPVLFPDPATRQMKPNPDFLRVVEAKYNKDARLIIGCQAGGRSQYAADLLVQEGFKDVSNMQGGFGGARDPMGRVVAMGWVQMNFPVENLVDETNSYRSLLRTIGGK